MPTEAGRAVHESGLESHIGALRQRDEAGALEARLAALEARLVPERPAVITVKTIAIIGSLIAALIPLTTAIDGYLKWRKDLAVAQQQQAHAARMDTLKTVLSAQLPEIERESRLRLLVSMIETGDPIHRWAEDELVRVEKTVAQLTTQQQAELQEVQRWTEKATAAAVAVEAAGGRLPADASDDEAPSQVTPRESGALGSSPRVRPPAMASATTEGARKEYLTAKRMTEAAAFKANATTKRLTGAVSINPKKLEQRLTSEF